MTQAITLQSNTLSLWQASQSIKPFAQEIFLLKTYVAGTYFANADEFLPENESLPLAVKLKREPKNQYDELAILVLTEQGEKLGYIPRKNNEVIARLMDAGKAFSAQITGKQFEMNWLKLEIEIFLVEQ